WTVAVLAKLEEAFRARGVRFPYHVRLFTGASGGMAGAAYYVAGLPPPDEERAVPLDRAVRNIQEDSLTHVVHRMVYWDFLSSFVPFPVPTARGRPLEAAWRYHLGGALDATFAAVGAGEAAGWRPSLVFSPMLVEDGRQLLISNLDLKRVVENRGHILTKLEALLSREGLEF